MVGRMLMKEARTRVIDEKVDRRRMLTIILDEDCKDRE